jgi:hypothetical protein
MAAAACGEQEEDYCDESQRHGVKVDGVPQRVNARGIFCGRDAAVQLERPMGGFSPGLTPVEVLRALERGRVNERLGNRERAIEGYSLVVRAWRNPDPALQPYVQEARAALARLNAEQP